MISFDFLSFFTVAIFFVRVKYVQVCCKEIQITIGYTQKMEHIFRATKKWYGYKEEYR